MSDRHPNPQLDAFLRAGRSGPAPERVDAPAPEPEASPEPQERVEVQETPVQQEAPQTAPAASDEPADNAEPEPQHFKQLRQSVEHAKKEREDWKARAIQSETREAELKKQFEAAQRGVPQPAPNMEPVPQLDIREAMARDPTIRAAVLTRLDTSEMLLRRELGDEAVNQLQADFQQAMAEDPTLQTRVLAQRDPYRWAHGHMKSLQLHRQINSDPEAYRAQIRAEIEAEMLQGRTNGNGGVQHRPSPAAGMAPSLANTRSVASRGAGGWTGPRSLEEIVSRIRKPPAQN